MASLETAIDEIYRQPLPEFVAARTRLAKTLSGDDQRRVKTLAKPTVVPWAINQVYWRDRPAYNRVSQSGQALRKAQIDALNGRAADVQRAAAAERSAVSHAVASATRLAAMHGIRVEAEPIARMFEALGVAPTLPESPGRFTKVLQPIGFEALAGITIKPSTHAPAAAPTARTHKQPLALVKPSSRAEERQRRERERAAAARQAEAAITDARKALERARTAEEQAHAAWNQATVERKAAERALHDVERRGAATAGAPDEDDA